MPVNTIIQSCKGKVVIDTYCNIIGIKRLCQLGVGISRSNAIQSYSTIASRRKVWLTLAKVVLDGVDRTIIWALAPWRKQAKGS